MASSGAYDYGVYLGTLQRNIASMFDQIGKGFAAGLKPPSQLTLEEVEFRRERKYHLMIEVEKKKGRDFVRNEAIKICREYGLPTT